MSASSPASLPNQHAVHAVVASVTARIALEDVVTKGFDVLVDPRGDQLKVLASPALVA